MSKVDVGPREELLTAVDAHDPKQVDGAKAHVEPRKSVGFRGSSTPWTLVFDGNAERHASIELLLKETGSRGRWERSRGVGFEAVRSPLHMEGALERARWRKVRTSQGNV